MGQGSKEDIRKNVAYVIYNWPVPGLKRMGLASLIKSEPSTLHRWLKGKTTPSSTKISVIATQSGIPIQQFYKPHDQFVAAIDEEAHFANRAYEQIQQQISLRSIQKWRHLWGECFSRHKGSYLLYNRIGGISLDGDKSQYVAVSLLTIDRKTDRGIEFEIHNIDDRDHAETGQKIHYEYKGLMFPIYDALCFFGEEESGDEPITIVASSSQKRRPILSGYLAAIKVTPFVRVATGTKILLANVAESKLTVSTLQSRLGVFEERRISEKIRNQI